MDHVPGLCLMRCWSWVQKGLELLLVGIVMGGNGGGSIDGLVVDNGRTVLLVQLDHPLLRRADVLARRVIDQCEFQQGTKYEGHANLNRERECLWIGWKEPTPIQTSTAFV